MKFLKEIKCLCYLFKCSKYLYYAKKLLCIFTLCFAALICLGLAMPQNGLFKKLGWKG